MREGAVGLGHLEEVLATLHGSANAIGGVENLVGKALGQSIKEFKKEVKEDAPAAEAEAVENKDE